VDNGAEAGLALDDDVGNTHLPAEGREVDDQLNWIYIVSNDDQGGFLGLNESDGVIEAVFDEEGLLCVLRLRVRYGLKPSINHILLFSRRRFLGR